MRRTLPVAVFVLVLALAVTAALWLDHREGAPWSAPAAPANGASAPAAAAPVAGAEQVANEIAAEHAREAAPPAGDAAPTTGALRVLATWPGDGPGGARAPAPGVQLTLRGASLELGTGVLGRERADGDGRATFASQRAGRAELTSDRGDRLRVDVTGGGQEVVFDLGGGVAVSGVVVGPDRQGVAGASVWLQTRDNRWSGGSVLATTAADGRFALERVPVHVSLGAFAAGLTASPLVDLDVVDTTTPPVAVTLVLGAGGGAVGGVVADEGGAPIVGALVGLGREDGRIDMRGERVVEGWSIRSTETDRDGRFELVGITPGTWPLTARAVGRGFARRTIEVTADTTTTANVTMQRSGTIDGVVTDAAGAPLPGARIRSYDVEPRTPYIAMGQIDFDEAFGHVQAVAGAAGAFTLVDVTAGTAHVFAQPGGDAARHGRSVPFARAALEIAPGATVAWNPVISEGRAILGVVRYRDGHAMRDVFVSALDEKSQARHVVHTDRDGAFRITNLDDSTYTVVVQYREAPRGTPALERGGVVPGPGRVELTAPFDKPVERAPGSVLGRVDDVGGRIRNVKAARVALMSDGRWFFDNGTLVDGAFRFDEVQPCRFRLALMEDDRALAHSDWHELLPGAVLDTGVLQTAPGGAVRITITRAPGTERSAPTVWLQAGGAPRGTRVEIGEANEVLVDSLCTGRHKVTAFAKGLAYIDTHVTVTAGATTPLALAFEPGCTCRVSVWLPEGATPERYRYTVTGADGRVLRERAGEVGSMPTRPFPIVVTVPLAACRLDFDADGKWSGTLPLHPKSTDDVEARLDVTAKR